MEILKTEFSLKETPEENKTSLFIQKPDQNDLLLRRGNILILKIHTSLLLSCEYTVSLVFVATRMKRERYGEFRANGCAKDAKELWLSINIPANFPVGRFLPHITLTLKGVPEIFTHFHEGSITVLFNPWNPGEPHWRDDTYRLISVDVSVQQQLLSLSLSLAVKPCYSVREGVDGTQSGLGHASYLRLLLLAQTAAVLVVVTPL